jgi:hypothetical protein
MAPALLDVTKNRDKVEKKAMSSAATLEDLIDRLELNQVDYVQKANTFGFCGMQWDVFLSRQQWLICVWFGIKVYKIKKRDQTINFIERCCKFKKVYQSMH